MPDSLKDTVPVPREILDAHMPNLTDCELRLILAVTRQTLGWRTPAGDRKRREWISHSWLRRMTGRSGSCVSGATESLVAKGLIKVTDARGNLLHSRESRRRHRGRLYFELDCEVRRAATTDERDLSIGKSKQIKEKEIIQSSSGSTLRRAGWHRAIPRGSLVRPSSIRLG